MCTVYSLDDSNGDTSFSNFNMNRVPSYLFSVLRDIMVVNGYLKVHILPWSPVRVIDSCWHIGRWLCLAGLDEDGRNNERRFFEIRPGQRMQVSIRCFEFYPWGL